MTTIAEVIDWYNKRNETTYHKVEVQITKDGKVALYENFYDVHDVSEGYILCFYGKNHSSGEERFFRIDNAIIIRSEV
jgi:hypothetical protein